MEIDLTRIVLQRPSTGSAPLRNEQIANRRSTNIIRLVPVCLMPVLNSGIEAEQKRAITIIVQLQ